MNLTSLISTAAGGWIPWAATAATKLAGNLPFSSLFGSTEGAGEAAGAATAAAEPDFPLSSSDRDRLERLLSEDLDGLANMLRADPSLSGDANATFQLTLDASGQAKATTIGEDGQMREVDLGESDEMASLLRRMASCLKRISPAGEGSAPESDSWQIQVDRAGARLIDRV